MAESVPSADNSEIVANCIGGQANEMISRIDFVPRFETESYIGEYIYIVES